jgi:hypothetical protein
VTEAEQGTAHAWAAVNQNGTILFLDPQTGRLSQDTPLYHHAGQRNDGNVVSMDAMVVDGQARVAPLPYHQSGLWSRSQPTGVTPESDGDAAERETLGERNDRPGVRLPGDPDVRRVGDDNQPHRLPGATGQSLPGGDPEPVDADQPHSDPAGLQATLRLGSSPGDGGIAAGEPDRGGDQVEPVARGGPVEPSGSGVDLRAGTGGTEALQRSVSGHGPAGGSKGREADGADGPQNGPAERGILPGDARDAGSDPGGTSPGGGGVDSSLPPIPTPRILASEMVAEDFDPKEIERRQLEALNSEHREVIELAVNESMVDAARIQVTLERVVESLHASSGDYSAQLVGLENRYKSASSLARAFAAEFEAEGTSPQDFLANTKDRVRFSIQLGEQNYDLNVMSAISELRERGHDVKRGVNFWGGGGRHNGLNVTVTDPQGTTYELQFPTELSRSIGEQTHRLYEVLRHSFAPYPARVDAFLRILAINIREDIDSRQPDGVDELRQLGTVAWKDVDSTFHTWIRSTRIQWITYLGDIEAEGSAFDRILSRNGLSEADVFESDGSDGDDRP